MVARDEIDLREIALATRNRWRQAVLAVAVGIAGGLFFAAIRSPIYRAAATVVVTRPDVVFQFEPRIQTQTEPPSIDDLSGIVTSDEMIATLIESSAAQRMPPEARTVEAISRSLNPSTSGSVLALEVSHEDPAVTSSLANVWAEAVIEKLQAIYAPPMEDASSFESRALDALDRWQVSQEELIEFQRGNEERILSRQLSALESQLSSELARRAFLEVVLSDVESVADLTRLDDSETSTGLREDLLSVVLTWRALGSSTAIRGEAASVGTSSPADFPFLLSADVDIIPETPREQAAYMGRLAGTVRTQLSSLDADIEHIYVEILSVQGDLSHAQEQRELLELQRDLARETYESLARKAQEAQIADPEELAVARLASRAVTPTSPSGLTRAMIVLIGAVIGLSVAGLVIVVPAALEKHS